MILHNTFHDRIVPILMYGLIICILLLSLTSLTTAAVFYQNGTEIDRDILSTEPGSFIAEVHGSYPIQFFYSHSCGSCRDAIDFLRSFIRKNPNVPINFHNLGSGDESRLMYHEYKNRYGGVRISYPVVFIGDIVITGSGDIVRFLPLMLSNY